VAEQIGREAEQRPQDQPQVNVNGIEEVVADKGYHSGAVLQRLNRDQIRSYIPEKQQKGRRKWQGKEAEQQAVYQNRRRVQGEYGKSLLRRRGELLECSFAHCYDTGGMRRTYLRGHNNILKRQLIHVGAFNLSLILRKLMGAGTPREWKNRGVVLFGLIYSLLARHEGPVWFYSNRISMFRVKYSATTRIPIPRCRSQRSPIYTTGSWVRSRQFWPNTPRTSAWAKRTLTIAISPLHSKASRTITNFKTRRVLQTHREAVLVGRNFRSVTLATGIRFDSNASSDGMR